MSEKKRNAAAHNNHSEKLEWIDLEDNLEYTEDDIWENDPDEDGWEEETDDDIDDIDDWEEVRRKRPKKKKKSSINLQSVLLILIALVFFVIAYKLIFWNKREHKNTELENDTTLSFETEPMDYIVPLDATSGGKKEKDDDLRILFVGNGSLADDKSSASNLANIVREKSGATVYNCAIPGSYMSMKNHTYKGSYPYDAFSFYYLCTLFTIGNTETVSWAERDLGGLPEDVKESIDLLQSIDYKELDVLCIYYDAADYLEQRSIIDFDNETNPMTFCGALNAGIELVQELLPDTRIIVMSPAYAYVVDKDGNYKSCFETDILEDILSIYIGLQAQTCMADNVSFVDNFYGSIYEELAPEYLKDSILLNEKGHALLADRFLDALNKFHDYDF